MDPVIGQIVLGALLIFLPIVGFSYLASYRDKYKHSKNWQNLARLTELKFIAPATNNPYPSVDGDYHGYHLNLNVASKTNEDNQDFPHTRIVLTRNNATPATDTKPHLQDSLKPFISPPVSLKGKIFATTGGQQIYYEQFGIETDIQYLQNLFDMLTELAQAYPHILALDVLAKTPLQETAKNAILKGDKGLRPIILQLLDELTQSSGSQTQNYQVTHRYCPHCLTRCNVTEHSTLNYTSQYHCRICGQNEEFLDWAGPIVALLDNGATEEITFKKETLRINWCIRGALFDFDAVHIRRATDQEVEKFAIQVGNDTDEYRKPQYATMPCSIPSTCHISENTLRILRHTFGHVEIN